MVMRPAITINMAITVANIGRFIKKLLNMAIGFYFCINGFTVSPLRTLRSASVT